MTHFKASSVYGVRHRQVFFSTWVSRFEYHLLKRLFFCIELPDFSVLFSNNLFLSLCHHYTVFISGALKSFLKSGTASPPALRGYPGALAVPVTSAGKRLRPPSSCPTRGFPLHCCGVSHICCLFQSILCLLFVISRVVFLFLFCILSGWHHGGWTFDSLLSTFPVMRQSHGRWLC